MGSLKEKPNGNCGVYFLYIFSRATLMWYKFFVQREIQHKDSPLAKC